MSNLDRLYRTFLSKMDEAEEALGALENALYETTLPDENDALSAAIDLTSVNLWTEAYDQRMRRAIKAINEAL